MSTSTSAPFAGGGEGSSPVPVNTSWIIDHPLTSTPSVLSSFYLLSLPLRAPVDIVLVPPQISDGLFTNPHGGQSRPDENGVQTSWAHQSLHSSGSLERRRKDSYM